MPTIVDGPLPTSATTAKPAPRLNHVSRPVRIARVITRLNLGGPAVHVVLATKHLAALGFTTTLITGKLAPGERSADELIAELDEAPVLIEQLERDPSFAKDVTTLLQLIRIFRRQRPDIVHTHTSKAGALGRIAAWIAGVPIRVHTYHGLVLAEHFSGGRSQFYIELERFLARLSTRLVAISPKQKADLETHFRIAAAEKIECIPLGLDLEPYLMRRAPSFVLRSEFGLLASDNLVGWVGRLAPIKDPFLLVEVARRVVDAMPTCHFVVVGDGELRSELEDAVRQAGLTDNVHLIGWRTDLAEIYSDLDLVILTSKNEGTPLVLLETMACGKTFVATDVGGIPDLTAGEYEEREAVRYFENAALTTRSATSLTAATLRLLGDPQLRQKMSEKAREFVSARFSASRLVGDLAALYESLLQESGMAVRAVTAREV